MQQPYSVKASCLNKCLPRHGDSAKGTGCIECIAAEMLDMPPPWVLLKDLSLSGPALAFGVAEP